MIMTEPIEIPERQEVLTSKQMSLIINMSPKYISKMAYDGMIPGIFRGNEWLFVKEQVISELMNIAKIEQINRQSIKHRESIEPEKQVKKIKKTRNSGMVDLTDVQNA